MNFLGGTTIKEDRKEFIILFDRILNDLLFVCANLRENPIELYKKSSESLVARLDTANENCDALIKLIEKRGIQAFADMILVEDRFIENYDVELLRNHQAVIRAARASIAAENCTANKKQLLLTQKYFAERCLNIRERKCATKEEMQKFFMEFNEISTALEFVCDNYKTETPINLQHQLKNALNACNELIWVIRRRGLDAFASLVDQEDWSFDTYNVKVLDNHKRIIEAEIESLGRIGCLTYLGTLIQTKEYFKERCRHISEP